METISEYQQQALNFLSNHRIDCEIEYLKFGKHFPDDKELRKIYKVTFEKEDGRAFSVNFGSSVATGTCTEYDVLTCITKSDPGDFEEFCSEFGYDEDSRKAYRIWESVRDEWEEVENFFSEEELAELQEIN